MIGQVLSHYRILEQIGAGGMGVVYRAHDEQLDRDVAIKVLAPGTLTDEVSRKRFRKEALALAKLNHSNIATIHEFGNQNGIDFLVTEYIKGVTLDAKLASSALAEEEVLSLGSQLAAGLAAAHDQGVIHRDLKPGNLRVSGDGLLKILDFGLARLAGPETQLPPTATGTLTRSQEVTGTLPYMAPEQLRGLKTDERTDIWAAGAVLYEMSTGCRPFPQEQSTDLMVAILQQPPTQPRQLNPRISPGLESIILKTLNKEGAHRPQSARELRADLQRLGVRPSAAPVRSPSQPSPSSAPQLEIAHVLFMDIVGYSKLPMDAQRERLHELQELVSGTSEFAKTLARDKLLRLPTGDGMALVFFGDPVAPVRCALESSRTLRQHSDVRLRMGIHTGPVYRVQDINAARNVTGSGINMAQRVMDCGDANHILLSKAVADTLRDLGGWENSLNDLGETEVKHGVRIHVYNLVTIDAGNPELPQKVRPTVVARAVKVVPPKRFGSRAAIRLALSLSAGLAVAVFIFFSYHVWTNRAAGRPLRSFAALPHQPSQSEAAHPPARSVTSTPPARLANDELGSRGTPENMPFRTGTSHASENASGATSPLASAGREQFPVLLLGSGHHPGSITVGNGHFRFEPGSPKDSKYHLEFPLSEVTAGKSTGFLHISWQNRKDYYFTPRVSEGSSPNVDAMVDAVNRAIPPPDIEHLRVTYLHPPSGMTPGTITIEHGRFRFEPDDSKDSKHHFEFLLTEMDTLKGDNGKLHIRVKNGKKYNFLGLEVNTHATVAAINQATGEKTSKQ